MKIDPKIPLSQIKYYNEDFSFPYTLAFTNFYDKNGKLLYRVANDEDVEMKLVAGEIVKIDNSNRKYLEDSLYDSFKTGFVTNPELPQNVQNQISEIYDNLVSCEDFEIEVNKGIITLNIEKPSKAMKEALEKLNLSE